MLTLVLLAASVVPAPWDGDICLADARYFGVQPLPCRAIWLQSSNHGRVMRGVVGGGWNNSPTVVAQWESEIEWRARCWFLLDDALNCPHLTNKQKMRSLRELRDLIGNVDYYGGRMPSPTPSYHMPEYHNE